MVSKLKEDISLPPRGHVWAQSDVECCTSCAIAVAMEAKNPSYEKLSPIFHYRQSKARPDEGISFQRAIALAFSHGIPKFDLHQFDITQRGLKATPSLLSTQDARSRRLLSLGAPIQTLPRARKVYEALHRKNPVLIEIVPDEAYNALNNRGAEEWFVSGTLQPGASKTHTVVIIGFQAATQRFVVQDSRGEDFGIGGQWFLSSLNLDKPNIIKGRELK